MTLATQLRTEFLEEFLEEFPAELPAEFAGEFATGFPGECRPVPARRRTTGDPRLASVTVLRPPRDRSGYAAPLRLTRRGIAVVALAVAALGIALVSLARVSAAGTRAPTAGSTARVTVAPGDTLWSIATRVAPQTDPRAEVAAIEVRNHLSGVALTPGQVLRLP